MKYVKLFENFEFVPSIKKGDLVPVKHKLFQGQPTYEVEAYNDSSIHEGECSFSFL